MRRLEASLRGGNYKRRPRRKYENATAGGTAPAFFLLLVIVAIVLGLVGVVVKGLLFLLFIGIVVFLGALLLGALRMRRRPGKPSAR
jgi:Flp pilus assembly protein TadB